MQILNRSCYSCNTNPVKFVYCCFNLYSQFCQLNCPFTRCKKKNKKQEAHGPWRSAWEPTWPWATVSDPDGVKIELIFALQAAVPETWADFQNSYIWVWNVATGQRSRSCTYIIFLHQGVEIELIVALWEVKKFLRYGRIFKIAIFGHETWPFAKVPEVAHMLSFYPRGRNWAYFCSTVSGFGDIDRFSKLPYLGMKLGNLPKCQNCTYTYKTTPESHISLRFALRLTISKILAVLHFPMGIMIKISIVLKINLNWKFQNSYKQILCGLLLGTFRKSLVEKKSKL